MNQPIVKRSVIVLTLLTALFFNSSASPKEQPNAKILKDFNTFWDYYSYNIFLARAYNSFDLKGAAIKKGIFLDSLATGRYIAVKFANKDKISAYKLVGIPLHGHDDISTTMAAIGKQYQHYFTMEGKPLPNFDFTDLNGNHYTPQNTKGKFLVVKCWFIRCSTCNAEIPELNELVDHYRNQKDILFVSLANDNKKDLINFSKKKKFNYAIVPDQESYTMKKIGVNGYPTHILVDKNGNVIKVMDNLNDLMFNFNERVTKKS